MTSSEAMMPDSGGDRIGHQKSNGRLEGATTSSNKLTSEKHQDAAAIARALGGKANGDGYLVPCPVPSHGQGKGDRRPSLSLRDGDHQLLVRCYAGCDPRDVLAELRRRGLLDDHVVKSRQA